MVFLCTKFEWLFKCYMTLADEKKCTKDVYKRMLSKPVKEKLQWLDIELFDKLMIEYIVVHCCHEVYVTESTLGHKMEISETNVKLHHKELHFNSNKPKICFYYVYSTIWCQQFNFELSWSLQVTDTISQNHTHNPHGVKFEHAQYHSSPNPLG